MDASLQPIVAALAELGDDELSALITTANSGPQMAPGLLAWIEHRWRGSSSRASSVPKNGQHAVVGIGRQLAVVLLDGGANSSRPPVKA